MMFILITLVVLPGSIKCEETTPVPVLSIVKHVSKTIVAVGENITVTVEIINTSNKTAYNVTLIEPRYPKWAFKVYGEPNASWRVLGSGQRVYNIYTLQILTASLEEISLGYAYVIWYDENGTRYDGRSEEIVIRVVPTKAEKIRASLFISRAVLFGIPLFVSLGIALVVGELIVYWKWRKYERERKRRKRR